MPRLLKRPRWKAYLGLRWLIALLMIATLGAILMVLGASAGNAPARVLGILCLFAGFVGAIGLIVGWTVYGEFPWSRRH